MGAFRIERNKKPLALYSRKVEALFAYLVLHPAEHAREKPASLFWGGSNDEQARISRRVNSHDDTQRRTDYRPAFAG